MFYETCKVLEKYKTNHETTQIKKKQTQCIYILKRIGKKRLTATQRK